MSWRNYYDAEYYPLIESDLVQGYNLLEKLVEKCYEVKKTLEQRVKFDEEQIQMYYPISSYPNSSYKTVESLPTYTTENLDTIFDEYVVDKLTDYSSKMNIEYCCTSVINSNYLDEGDLEINFSNGEDIETGIKIYVDAQVTSNATYGVGNINIDLSCSLGRISSRLNEFVTQCTTESIINFATHLNIFVDSKNETSQHTDFHDDLKVVYSSRMKKFSISSFDDLLDYEYLQTEQEYTNFMSQPVSGVNENIMTVTNNPQNIREKMVSSGSVNYECGKYIEAAKSRLREFDNYRNIVEGLSYKIELQLSAHEAEYKVNSEVKSFLDSINLDSDISLLEQLKYINDVYLSNDTYLSSKNQELLGIEEDDYLKSDNCQLDEVYLEIINSYVNAEITDDELINLCVEYPYLNLYIEQYLIDNVSLISDNSDKNQAKMYANLQILNSSAKSLIENGITSIENIKVVGENKINFDGIYFVDTYGTEIESCSIYYGQVLEGEDGGTYTLSMELNDISQDNLDEIEELTEKYNSVSSFASDALYDFGKDKIEGFLTEAVFETIKLSFPAGPALAVVAEITYEEFKDYWEVMEDVNELTEENKSIYNAFQIKSDLEQFGQLPFGYTYTVVGNEIIDSEYIATPDTYQVVNNAYDLEAVNNPGTSQEDRDKLQDGLIQQAYENGSSSYAGGQTPDEYVYEEDGSGIVTSVKYTYEDANGVTESGALDAFSDNQYINDNGTLDMYNFMLDYLNPNNNYEDMFYQIDQDIIQNSGKDSDSDE